MIPALTSATECRDMGVKRPGESHHDVADITDDELDALDDLSPAAFRATASTVAGRNPETAPLSAEDLGHVAPGCYVQFGTHGMRCWMEITRVEGDTLSGRIHQELSNPICLIEYCNAGIVSVRRDQVTALGCDRYCWC
jgi:hypothetical protein